MTTPNLPGRLGNPDLTLGDDPRADPRMVAAMRPIGLAERTPPQPVTVDSPLDELHEFNAIAESGYDMLFGMLTADLAPVLRYAEDHRAEFIAAFLQSKNEVFTFWRATPEASFPWEGTNETLHRAPRHRRGSGRGGGRQGRGTQTRGAGSRRRPVA
jgi:hypothetical protein